jgi:hypothetical protein
MAKEVNAAELNKNPINISTINKKNIEHALISFLESESNNTGKFNVIQAIAMKDSHVKSTLVFLGGNTRHCTSTFCEIQVSFEK